MNPYWEYKKDLSKKCLSFEINLLLLKRKKSSWTKEKRESYPLQFDLLTQDEGDHYKRKGCFSMRSMKRDRFHLLDILVGQFRSNQRFPPYPVPFSFFFHGDTLLYSRKRKLILGKLFVKLGARRRTFCILRLESYQSLFGTCAK